MRLGDGAFASQLFDVGPVYNCLFTSLIRWPMVLLKSYPPLLLAVAHSLSLPASDELNPQGVCSSCKK